MESQSYLWYKRWEKFAWCMVYFLDFNIFLGFDMEKAMATHSSTLAWKIPWMKKPGGQSDMTE